MNDHQHQPPVRKLRAKAKALAGSHEFGVSSNQNEQVGLRVQIIGGEFDGQMVTWYGTFSPAAEDRTLEQLQIAGWTGDNILDLPGLGSTEFEVQLEEYEGQDGETGEHFTWLKVAWINRVGVTMKNAMTANDKASFAARMNAKMGKGVPTGGGGGRRPTPNGRQQHRSAQQHGGWDNSPHPADDDIPL